MVGSTPGGRKLVEDYYKKGWIYLGGETTPNNKAHINYWQLSKNSYNLTDDDLPPHLKNCECGEKIMYNCLIFNKVNYLRDFFNDLELKAKNDNIQYKSIVTDEKIFCKELTQRIVNDCETYLNLNSDEDIEY